MVGKCGRLIAKIIPICSQCNLAAPPRVFFSPPFDSGLAFQLVWANRTWQGWQDASSKPRLQKPCTLLLPCNLAEQLEQAEASVLDDMGTNEAELGLHSCGPPKSTSSQALPSQLQMHKWASQDQLQLAQINKIIQLTHRLRSRKKNYYHMLLRFC